MLRSSLLTGAAIVGGLFIGVSNASAAELFTTSTDFSQWAQDAGATSAIHTAVTTPDSDGSTVNGLGDSTAPGATGTAGAMTIVVNQPFDNSIRSPGEQGNAAFLAALHANNQVSFDFSTPILVGTPTNGFFQLGIVINSSDGFGQDTPLATDPAIVDLGNGFSRETVTIPAAQLASATPGFFQLGILVNTNFSPGTTVTVDNIQTVTPEPASLGLLAMGGLLGMRRRRA